MPSSFIVLSSERAVYGQWSRHRQITARTKREEAVAERIAATATHKVDAGAAADVALALLRAQFEQLGCGEW